MKTILMSATLLLTISLSVTLGVIAAYAAIYGILRAMGHRTEKHSPPQETLARAS